MNADRAVAWVGEHEGESLERLKDWLRIPSVSTDPAYKADVRRAGQWAADHLKASGFEVEVRETGDPAGAGHPIVLAKSAGSAAYKGPHVLFYGHYDVQPPDPVDLWRSPPFEPVVEEGKRLVARGSCDDKGQVATFLEAMRAWKETTGETAGGVRMTVLLEGEEESGSVNLERFVAQHKDELSACAVCVISDTGMLAADTPAITYGVRGLAYTEVTLHGPDQDLHSGMWGGKVPNPNNELVKVLAQLWDGDRRVTVPGFYDGVPEPSADERAAWQKLGVDEAASLKGIGYGPEASVGEKGYSFIEREWARPTAEINGIFGGYTGKGAKTVIPSHATAKVSFRLVADQDPAAITAAFFAWLGERTPPGCRWEFVDHGGGLPATLRTDSDPLRAAARALERAAGKAPVLIKSGGSIPVAGLLKGELGIETIFAGFGLEDDRVHSPNEKFDLACFRLGLRTHAVLVEELWKLGSERARSVSDEGDGREGVAVRPLRNLPDGRGSRGRWGGEGQAAWGTGASSGSSMPSATGTGSPCSMTLPSSSRMSTAPTSSSSSPFRTRTRRAYSSWRRRTRTWRSWTSTSKRMLPVTVRRIA
ncbi:MAG: M20/M25/M40 family metallo-hydrolase [Phycisphaerales bacterium]